MKKLNIKNSKLNLLVALAVAVFSMLFALLFTNTAYADDQSLNSEDIGACEVVKDPITVQVPVTYRQEDVIALGSNLQVPVTAPVTLPVNAAPYTVPVTLNTDVLSLGNNLQLPVSASPVGYYNPDTPMKEDVLD